jgi:hypothetical protein
MPGSISDAYDPEFGTETNVQDIQQALHNIIEQIDIVIGLKLKYIVDVIR